MPKKLSANILSCCEFSHRLSRTASCTIWRTMSRLSRRRPKTLRKFPRAIVKLLVAAKRSLLQGGSMAKGVADGAKGVCRADGHGGPAALLAARPPVPARHLSLPGAAARAPRQSTSRKIDVLNEL